ncbi:alpha/beta fold hydrolase [Arthrobacter castelli]|uniref:alpha/beta fold hydrolase n=1 Tax=Arthrobacter castelli TaxID=271431 RepID=UPI00041F82FD|nr:alpha/beta fold hydrolase [Arthrobacter castelli]
MASNNLILGPSLGTSSFVWSKTQPLLPQSLQVNNFELPGHGPQTPAPGPVSISDIADQVIELADTLQMDTFHYVGISLSGSVGLDLALRYPGRLDSLAVVCSAAKFGERQAWLDRAEQVRAQGTAVLVEGSAQRWFAPGFIERDPDSVSQLLHDLSDADNDSYAYLCDALADFDLRERLSDVNVPTLVLSGEHDPVAPPETGRSVAEPISGAGYQTITDASHLAPIEQPDQVAQAMAGFIQERK